MKKSVTLIALSALAVLVGCQREPVTQETSEEVTGVREVTTNFVLNVATSPMTKMTADAVQQNHNFRGIQNAKIFAYKTGTYDEDDATKIPYVLKTAGYDIPATQETPAVINVKEFDLGLLMAANALDNTGDKNMESDSRRVLQLSIPVGVDAVLMYGKAVKGANDSDMEYGCTYDYVYNTLQKANSVSSVPANTQFYAHPILDASVKPKYEATADMMIAVINKILATEIDATPSASFGPSGAQVTFNNLPALSWAQLGHQYEIDKIADSRYSSTDSHVEKLDHPVSGLEEVLGKCYYLFTYIRPANLPDGVTEGSDAWKAWILNNLGTAVPYGEYRAGSSFSVQKMIIDMYKIISAAKDAIPTNENEANATRLADVIIGTAENFFNSTDGTYKSVANVKTALGSSWSSEFSIVTDLNDYPGQFNVPEGAAQLGFHAQGSPISGSSDVYAEDLFFYYHPNHPLVNPLMTTFEPRKYLYPAELWYYVNSPIRVTSKDVAVDDYPNGVTPWNTTSSWTAGEWESPGQVASATRAVAVTNSLNYGVALLKSNVSTSATILEDNRAALTDESTNRQITVSGSQIVLKGILIGGVNPRMNWQFTRFYTQAETPSSSEDLSLFDGVIYDQIPTKPAISSSITNYTLVYDNYNSSEAASNQNDVFVALEFENGGDAFWGRDNLIPTGGTFYLVGKLPKPTADQITGFASKWPTDHQIPPVYGINGVDDYTAVSAKPGESKKIPRIFIQDFMTTANFTIGTKSLQHAYYSVPDLRASQMSLGLSVDLQWNTGLSFDVPL